MVNDAKVRDDYVKAVSKLKKTDGAARSAIKKAARQKTSPLGQGIAETMRPAAKEATRIGGTASKTNAVVNKVMKVAKPVGRGLVVAGVGISAYNVATAEDKDKPKVIAQETGAWVGALSFGAAGAKLGATIGSMIVPGLGTAIGALVGGLIGAIVGAILGEKAGENIHNALEPKTGNRLKKRMIPQEN